MFNRYYRYIILFLLFPSVCFGGVNLDWYEGVASGSCTTITDEQTATPNDAYSPWSGTDYLAYGILLSTSKSLCKTEVVISLPIASSRNLHAEVWTSIDRLGTQIGLDSASVTVPANQSQVWTSFTWATSPNPTTNYFIHIVQDDGGNVSIE